MEDIEKKRPPFISQICTNEEIDAVLQMTNSLLQIPHEAEIDGTRWSKSHNVLELLSLYEDDFILKCSHNGIFL
jgi:hypothetical protein